ncbi:MAG TPA: PAS domain S-box protein [Fimbriiglobus sp.]|jgi:PAS domain S-box-containing protein|nr:PAS domain S-box protein [Fimbriiglobus sp.]
MLSLLPSARIGIALAVGLLVAAAGAEAVGQTRLSQFALLLGGLTALAAVVRNAANHRRAELALRAGEEHLRAFFETSTVGMAEADAATGRFVRVNDAFCRMLGYTSDEATRITVRDTIPPEDQDRATGQFDRLCRGELASYQAERRYLRKDGSIIWALVYAVSVRDPGGSVTRIAGVFVDLTDRRKAEEEIAALNATLEQRVAVRTGELAEAIRRMADGVEERRRVEDRLRASEERFELAVRGSEDGIWDWDLRTDEVYYSPRWKAMLGYADDEVAGRIDEWRRLVHPDDLPRAEATLQAYQARQAPHYGLEVRMRHKDGSWRWVYTRGVAMWDESGRPYRMAGSHTDVTAWKAVEEELRQARVAAEAASRAKSDFLASMSHEIRTPMNGILGMTELALDTDLTSQQREYLRTVKESGEALLRIVNDILDVSKVEAGKLELDHSPFRLRESLDAASRPQAVRADQKGLSFTCRVAPDVPDDLIGDRGRLCQVLVNLVGNAIKFTDHGEVSVSVERVRDQDGGMSQDSGPGTTTILLHFTVTDTGNGIPADRQRAIFEAFAQADRSVARRYGGTGLGLTISSGLVGLMGGRIWVESEVGEGSRFHFTAAVSSVPKAAPVGAAPACAASPPPTRPLRVLVAEDQDVNQRLFVRMLEIRGHKAVTASTGREALDHLAAETFDAVLMDVQMPEMDGLTATTQLRERERGTGRRVPVIALTAYAMTEDRDRCLAAGCDEYLSKPVRKEDLYRVLEGLARTPPPAPVFDRAEALRQACGDEMFLRDLTDLFFQRWPEQLTELKAAAEAGRSEGVRQLAHALKGTLAVLGATAAADSARALQDTAARGEAGLDAPIGHLEQAVARFAEELDRPG